jgi:site-specific DNA-methyltransferase (adenine-specific)
MQQLGYKILNDIAWEKPNPPPNLSCRYFTHSTETLLWAAKGEKSKHCFNYPLMRQIAGGKQMKSVWRFTPPKGEEKKFGRHPTQKPVALVERCILASTKEGDLILDPFLGGGTTAVAALQLRRRCVGLELEEGNLKVALKRVDHARHLFLKPHPTEAPCPDEPSRSPTAKS